MSCRWIGIWETIILHTNIQRSQSVATNMVSVITLSMAQIEVDSLRKEFDVPGGKEIAVDGISFSIEEGEFITFVGPSGCGKTTTLRCIAGLETPTSGTITFNGTEVTDVPANRRDLAMMFQNIALYPHMTIRENIAYPLKVERVPTDERHEKAAEAAEIMQIPDLLDKYPGELSGGQRQRAALARTIVQDPIAFLMDEPLSDLDAKLKIDIRKEIQRVHQRLGKPTVYVTHDQEEAMTMSDRIAILNDGSIEQFGTRDEVYKYPENTFVARFIGNPSINFMDAEVVELTDEVGELRVHGQNLRFAIDRLVEKPTGDNLLLGFRPQAVDLGPDVDEPHFEEDLVLLEPVDDRALVRLEGPEGEIRALVPSELDLETNKQTPIQIRTDNLYLFDPDTEELVAKSKQSADRTVAKPAD